MRKVPVTEFTRNFGQYREIVQREPIAVTSHGRLTGYFVSTAEFEDSQKSKASTRRSRAVVELTPEEIEAVAASHMAPEHEHLNTLLDQE